MKINKEKKYPLSNNKGGKKQESLDPPSSLIEIRKNIGNSMMGDFLNELNGSTQDIREKPTKKSETMKEYEPNKKEIEHKGKLEKVAHLSMDTGDVSIGKFKEQDSMVIVPFMKNTRDRTANFKDMKRVKGVSATKKNFKGASYLSNPNGSKESATAIITGSKKKPSKIINNIQKALQNEDINAQNKLLEDIFPFLNDDEERGMIKSLEEERKKVMSRQEMIQGSNASLKEQKELLDYKTYIDAEIKKLKDIIERKKRRKRMLLTRFLSIQLKMKMMKKAGLELEENKISNILEESLEEDEDNEFDNSKEMKKEDEE